MINIDSVEKSKPNLEIDLFIKSRIDSFVLKLKNKTKRQFYLKSAEIRRKMGFLRENV